MRKINQEEYERAIIAQWDKIDPQSEFGRMQKRAAPASARLSYIILSELEMLPEDGGGEVIRLLAAINASILHNLSMRLHTTDGADPKGALFEAFTLATANFLATSNEKAIATVTIPSREVGDA